MSVIRNLYKKYIAGTARGTLIPLRKRYLCNIRRSVRKVIRKRKLCRNRRVYLSTKALKHIYDRHIFDKRTPDDFFCIINELMTIIKYPDRIYRNGSGKRGDFIFAREIRRRTYLIFMEIVSQEEDTTIEVVSAYRTGKNI